MQSPESQFAGLVEEFLGEEGVSFGAGMGSKRGFGSTALKREGKIFAMLVRQCLVLKLPAGRVEELVAQGKGERFDPGHGRVMKEWLSLAPGNDAEWTGLAREAMAFAGKRGRGG